MSENIHAAVERIERMERLFDDVSACLRNAPENIALPSVQRAIEALSEYLSSGDWLHDYTLDEQRKLPDGLKRGMLSQDGLYDMLCTLREQSL